MGTGTLRGSIPYADEQSAMEHWSHDGWVPVGWWRAERPYVVAAHLGAVLEAAPFTIELDHAATCLVDPRAFFEREATKRFVAEFNARLGLLE